MLCGAEQLQLQFAMQSAENRATMFHYLTLLIELFSVFSSAQFFVQLFHILETKCFANLFLNTHLDNIKNIPLKNDPRCKFEFEK